MLEKWLRRRWLKRLKNTAADIFERCALQAKFDTISDAKSPSPYEQDFLRVKTHCDNVFILIGVIESSLAKIKSRDYLERFVGVSKTRGTKTMTEYLTDSEGFGRQLAEVDPILRELLITLEQELLLCKKEREDLHSYYVRKLNTLIEEALSFRLQLIQLECNH